MGIDILDQRKFHLYTNNTSYVLQVDAHGQILHLYWGKRIHPESLTDPVRTTPILAFSPTPYADDPQYSLDVLPQEAPMFGRSDFREPLCQLRFDDGTMASEYVFESYRLTLGKPPLLGLPSIREEAGDSVVTLSLTLRDPSYPLTMTLSYSVLESFDVITRSVSWHNEGSSPYEMERALSMTVDFPDADYRLLHLAGAWARERGEVWSELGQPKKVSVESRRGASSHQMQPFLALARPHTTRDSGDIFATHLIYSGNFLAFAEVDQYLTTRIGIGINPSEFHWILNGGDTFQSPEAVLVYSDKGQNGMTSIFHHLYQERLIPPAFRRVERPILLNTWEAAYFKLSEETIVSIAESAADLGVELLVVDDGWFGHRDNDRSSLGDWHEDRNKFPDGLASTAQRVRSLGMKFGLWVEPEMISPVSALYAKHPEWCMGVPHRPPSLARHQLVLDLSRQDVQDFVIDTLSQLIEELQLDYLKWDMNRHLSEVGSHGLPPRQQQETSHRYILGLYRVLEAITTRYPQLLIEGCSGGGGRFDPGMLAYSPQIWASDNTDAVARLAIQQGTALVYPVSTVTAHVSDVPNHQTGRQVSLGFRAMVAMSGVLGYELDPRRLSDEDREAVKEQIRRYKEVRGLVQFGYYTVLETRDPNAYGWMFRSHDGHQALVFYFRLMARANYPRTRLPVVGLPLERSYAVREWEGHGQWLSTNGGELRHVGLVIPDLRDDYQAVVWEVLAL